MGGKQVVPANWFELASTPTAASLAASHGYGYQWWVDDAALFRATGIFGQFIALDPKRELVIVMQGAYHTPTDDGQYQQSLRFIQAIRHIATP